MTIRVAAPRAGSATAISLHGLGDSGSGLQFFPSEFHRQSRFDHINFVSPTADTRYFAAFKDSTTGWFDLKAMGCSMEEAIEDIEGIEKSSELVNVSIQREVDNGVPPERILVGGFSQGGGMTQATAFTTSYKLAGFLSLSGMSPVPAHFKRIKVDTNLDTPLFSAHGTADPVVPFSELKKSTEAFKEAGFTKVSPHEYKGLQHSLAPNEFDDIMNFFEKVLPKS